MSQRVARMDIEQLRAMLLVAPFHQWLGLEIAELTDTELILKMPWRDEIVSNPMIGSAHGGIISTLIDLTGLYRGSEYLMNLVTHAIVGFEILFAGGLWFHATRRLVAEEGGFLYDSDDYSDELPFWVEAAGRRLHARPPVVTFRPVAGAGA